MLPLSHMYFKEGETNPHETTGQTVSGVSLSQNNSGYHRTLIPQWPDVSFSHHQEAIGEISLSCSPFVWLWNYKYGTGRCKADKTQVMKQDKNMTFSTLLSPTRLISSPIRHGPGPNLCHESPCSNVACKARSQVVSWSLFYLDSQNNSEKEAS